jgi:HEAT repeat protein
VPTETLPAKPTPDLTITATDAASKKAVALTANTDRPQPVDEVENVVVTPSETGSPKFLMMELVSSDWTRRANAACELGRRRDVGATAALIAALSDSDADVAREAAQSLGLLGNSAAVEPLIAVLNNCDGYFHVVARIAACHSLGQLRDLRAVEPLLNAIRDTSAEVSAEAIGALASVPDPRGLPALLEVVRNQHGFFLAATRHAAILGLARFGGEQAICELRFVASNQWEDAVVRAAAIEATRQDVASPASN